eukprot:GFYU01004164.1.p1 GENE.GFYU01004164.1~~GFYU01004164.1.p1  ORF type:complete len:889 (+),score=242.71 GFYU01004164.1:100-2766(+)
MDDDAEEVFEIIDHTVATPWEKFIADIESMMRQWCLCGSNTQTAVDHEVLTLGDEEDGGYETYKGLGLRKQRLTYDNTPYIFKLFWCLEDVPDDSIDHFFPKWYKTRIQLWFGVKTFIKVEADEYGPGLDESQATLLLSALAIAASNADCSIPMFVPVNLPQFQCWSGYKASNDITTRYDVDRRERPPDAYSHLSGLIDVFRAKSGVPRELCQTLVSCKFTYVLDDYQEEDLSWRARSAAGMDCKYPLFMIENIAPWGPDSDPVPELQLEAGWPSFNEGAFLENKVYSEFKYLQAPMMNICMAAKSVSKCLLSSALRSIVSLRYKAADCTTISELIAYDDGNFLTRQFSSFQGSPLDPEQVHKIVQNILEPTSYQTCSIGPGKDVSYQMKTAPSNSLLTRVAIQFLTNPNPQAISMVWHKFVQMLRYHWDEGIDLPHVDPDATSADVGCCILYQKIQKIHYCIRRKRSHDELKSQRAARRKQKQQQEHQESQSSRPVVLNESGASWGNESWGAWDESEHNASTSSIASKLGNTSIDSNDDVFYQAEESFSAGGNNEPCDIKPVMGSGVKEVSKTLTLLGSGSPACLPFLQEPGFITEDEAKSQEEVLTRAQNDVDADRIREKLNAHLRSDMQAFKAANPECVFEDFIRWHSPSDWIQDLDSDDEEGRQLRADTGFNGALSRRMRYADNRWKQVWESARPIVASEQPLLFDHVREAEMTLHYLETVHPTEMLDQIIMCCLSAAYTIMATTLGASTDPVDTMLTSMKSSLVSLSHADEMDADDLTHACDHMNTVESTLAITSSLYHKVGPNPRLVTALLKESQCLIKGETERSEIVSALSLHPDNLPNKREFILSCHPPLRQSSVIRSRMYTFEEDGEFRVATVFSEDDR